MRALLCLLAVGVGHLDLAVADVRLTNDNRPGNGYLSAYTIGTGVPYTDAVLTECSLARGRQNEPSVAVNPRNTSVLVGSSNDYCGTYAGSTSTFVAAGPIWLGYYRSENSGATFQSSLVPGYPGDTSPYAAKAKVRTAGAGDPVIAWDRHGRVYFGAESNEDPSGSKKGFGDIWVARFDNPLGEGGATINDGKAFAFSTVIAKGSSSSLTGKFNDKTAIEVDRTLGTCDGNVYFAWSRFTGIGVSNIYFSRSTDRGESWSSPQLLTQNIGNVQDPDISVTGNGHVYVTFGQAASQNGQPEAISVAKSIDCGKSFAKPVLVQRYIPYAAQDFSDPQAIVVSQTMRDDPASDELSPSGGISRDCGDFANKCLSRFTFFRRETSPRSTADQYDAAHEWVYIVYDATKPGTEISTGTTYGSIKPGTGSQSGIFFTRWDGAAGVATTPVLIDNQTKGHQLFPDISADGGVLHVLWWDSRNDPFYSPKLPIGNDASGHVTEALDVYATKSADNGGNWQTPRAVNSHRSNPNFEQFDNRTVPFAGDYLWVTSLGNFAFGAWTDWQDTVPGVDPRETGDSSEGADVLQCRTIDLATGMWTSDQCPHAGGIDQNIYGAPTP